MKIAVVAPEVFPVPPIRGGAIESIIHELTTRLGDHEVHVFGIADSELPRRESCGHVHYQRYRFSLLDRALQATYRLPFKRTGSRWYYRGYSRWVEGHLRRLQPDVVHVMSRMPFVPWLRRAVPHAALIFSVHQASSLKGGSVWTQENIDCCDLITVCSEFLSRRMIERYPSTGEKVRVLYNGIDADRFRPWWQEASARHQARNELGLGKGPVVLYAGRLVEQKGAHILAEAFRDVAASVPDAKLLMTGSYTYSDERETPYIMALKGTLHALGGRVIWTGHVAPDGMARLYAASDLVVVPSVGPEAFSMVTLEAMASGLPVVAFAHGGPCELIEHGRTGVLVPPTEGRGGLVQAMTTLLEDPGRRRALGTAARAHVQRCFAWSTVMPRLMELYEEARGRRISGGGGVEGIVRKVFRPARVLIAESGSGYGGTAKYLSELVGLLDCQRFQVQVVAAHEGPFIGCVRASGIPLALRPLWRFPWGGAWKLSYLQYATVGLIQLAVLVPAITAYLRGRRIRLVHLNNEVLSHIPLLLSARLAGCRVVCHLHGWRSFTRLERWAVRFVDALVCITESGARFHSQQLGGRPVEAIPNGLLLNGQATQSVEKRADQRRRFGLSERDVAVAMLGRLVAWKGHEVYLRAMAEAIRHQPAIVGLIVGQDLSPDQGYLNGLKELTRELGIDSHIRFLPWQQDAWPIYAAADVIVHASTDPEPFGLVVLEAMAAGKPVVATRAGGVPDLMVHGETGLLVAPGNVNALSDAIQRLVLDADLAIRLGVQAKQRALTSFTMERNAAQVTGLYDRLLAQSRRGLLSNVHTRSGSG